MSDCSPLPVRLPDWLAAKSVTDDAFATAYEACTSAQRGWLKKCIALHFALSGEAPVRSSIQCAYPRLGVRTGCMQRPVDWCVLVLPYDVASPARALAAVMPALLASVSEVIVVRQGQDQAATVDSWPAGLLVGLELAGIRRVVDLTRQDTVELLKALLCGNSFGRVLALDSCIASGLSETLAAPDTLSRSVRYWFGPRPRIGVLRSIDEPMAESGATLADVLAWAHPDVAPDVLADHVVMEEAVYDALLVSAKDQDMVRQAAGIVLGPGVEGCWFWPDLDRGFFLRRTFCCSSTMLSENE